MGWEFYLFIAGVVTILFYSLYYFFTESSDFSKTFKKSKSQIEKEIKIIDYILYSNVKKEIEYLYFCDIKGKYGRFNNPLKEKIFPFSYMLEECNKNFEFDMYKKLEIPYDLEREIPYLEYYISSRMKVHPVEYFIKQVDEYIQNGIKFDYFHFSKKAILQYYILLNLSFCIEDKLIFWKYFEDMIDNKFKFFSILQDEKSQSFFKNVRKYDDIFNGKYFPNIEQILDLQITEECSKELLVYVEDINVKDRLYKKGLIHFYRCKNLAPFAINKKISFLDSYHAAIDSFNSFLNADYRYKKNFKKIETKMILEVLKTRISIQGNSSEELFNDYLRKKGYSINFDNWEEFA